MKLPIDFEDDGKGKWQSVAATLSVGDELANIYIMDWGANEEEAESKLLQKLGELMAKVGCTRDTGEKNG